MRNRLWLIVGLVALGACSKEKDIEPPAELVDFKTTLEVDRAWASSVGGPSDISSSSELRALSAGAPAEWAG